MKKLILLSIITTLLFSCKSTKTTGCDAYGYQKNVKQTVEKTK
jgi:hypothetical protein